MANSWFRLYAEFEDDPKVRMLSDAMQIRLVYLLCEKCKGVTLTERHRTFQWRCSDAELAETKRIFMDSGFIDEDWNLVNWNKRQFISDSSTDRTRRYRERVRTSQERHSDAGVTPPDTDTDTEQKKRKTTAAPFVIPEWVPKEQWEAWLPVRKRKRAENTPYALNLAIKKLAELKLEGCNPVEVLEQSILKGYTGLFPVTGKANGKQDPTSGMIFKNMRAQ